MQKNQHAANISSMRKIFLFTIVFLASLTNFLQQSVIVTPNIKVTEELQVSANANAKTLVVEASVVDIICRQVSFISAHRELYTKAFHDKTGTLNIMCELLQDKKRVMSYNANTKVLPLLYSNQILGYQIYIWLGWHKFHLEQSGKLYIEPVLTPEQLIAMSWVEHEIRWMDENVKFLFVFATSEQAPTESRTHSLLASIIKERIKKQNNAKQQMTDDGRMRPELLVKNTPKPTPQPTTNKPTPKPTVKPTEMKTTIKPTTTTQQPTEMKTTIQPVPTTQQPTTQFTTNKPTEKPTTTTQQPTEMKTTIQPDTTTQQPTTQSTAKPTSKPKTTKSKSTDKPKQSQDAQKNIKPKQK